ncbi:hypothetical protein K3X13_00035 [Aliiroseovarius crassostreae]|uniref:hypothetical protein n=1 Tax=Aliiroseovarius crassostreae TaxID=154981 RepID=UPI0021FD51CB|nr:hypothetical protein [Aliiroseovarius crassostreae]UWP92302.1 hypothetical protein K3X13_00035 [Aliiroseovarius crassostreae]
MSWDSRKWVGYLLVAVGVFAASLLLSGGAAEAHGKHQSSMSSAQVQFQPMQLGAEPTNHQDHCLGGAFCSGPAMIVHFLSYPVPMARSERYARSSEIACLPIASSFDPPPPRILS